MIAQDADVTLAYRRAESLLGHHRSKLLLHSPGAPHWIGAGPAFWYSVFTESGREFIRVDPTTGTKTPLFDGERLAEALRHSAQAEVDASDLFLEDLDVRDGEISFGAFDARWVWRFDTLECVRDDSEPRSPLERKSPDGKWVAFRKGHDLWVRSSTTSEAFALSTDGSSAVSYAVHPDSAAHRSLLNILDLAEKPPVLLWSPDSRKILTHRTDQRGVAEMFLIESSPPDGSRPRLHTSRYALPGEVVPQGEWVIFDVASRTTIKVGTGTFELPFLSPIALKKAWWSADGAFAYYFDQPRDLKTLALKRIDASTGEVRTLYRESGPTRLEPVQDVTRSPIVHVLTGGREALWYSQRSDRGQLYLLDLESGTIQGRVTDGTGCVQEIVHVDEENRVVYACVTGLVADDPYRQSFIVAKLDGSSQINLIPDDLDHRITSSPDGSWFVDSASTVEVPTVTTLRRADGSIVMEIERADVTRLREAGWTPPERFKTVAADGVTEVFGILYRPYLCDETKSYPVLDHVYPGPQIRRVEPFFDPGYFGPDAEAMAALGFVVIAMDGRGTPGRSKLFHDHSYRNLGSFGLDDHATAIQQLAADRPWMDLNRVGIFGHSGGGFAAARALMTYPDTYKVAVSESGNHDNRMYHAMWAEQFDGPYDPDAGPRLSNTELVDGLKGHLFLVHGEMDDNVTPHLTMRLVDRLIAADKDFDLLIVPGAEHGLAGYQSYVTRRRWDYFVKHLLHRDPPDYHLAPIPIAPELKRQVFN